MPRLQQLDHTWALSVARFCEEQRQTLLHRATGTQGELSQVEYVFLAGYSTDLGLLLYALGSPLDKVRDCFADAVSAYRQVFALRGSTDALEVVDASWHDGLMETGGVASTQAGQEKEGKDYSLTNSKRGLMAVYLALTIGEIELARQAASQICDPPDATYLGVDSVVCTLYEHHLGYAMKGLLIGDDELARAELRLIDDHAPVQLQLQAAIIRALTLHHPDDLALGIAELLDWHRRAALEETNRKETELLLCLPGLALSVLGLHQELVSRRQLPGDDPYLPLDLPESCITGQRIT